MQQLKSGRHFLQIRKWTSFCVSWMRIWYGRATCYSSLPLLHVLKDHIFLSDFTRTCVAYRQETLESYLAWKWEQECRGVAVALTPVRAFPPDSSICVTPAWLSSACQTPLLKSHLSWQGPGAPRWAEIHSNQEQTAKQLKREAEARVLPSLRQPPPFRSGQKQAANTSPARASSEYRTVTQPDIDRHVWVWGKERNIMWRDTRFFSFSPPSTWPSFTPPLSQTCHR